MKLKHLNLIFAGVLIVLAGVFFKYADTFKMLPGQADIGPKVQLFNTKFLIGLATAVLYFLLFKKVGFVLCSMASIFIMEVLLLNEPFKKAWPLITSVAILAPIAIYLIFGVALKVPLPAGLLSFLF